MDTFEKLAVALTKVTPAPAFCIAIAVTLILFLPSEMIVVLGVEEFREQNRGTIGWTFIISYSYLAVLIVFGGWKYVQKRISRWRNIRRRQQQLHKLTSAEKAIMGMFMSGETTVYRPVNDGLIGGLLASNVVYRSSNAFDLIEGVPYNLQPWAREYLEDHLEIFKGFFEDSNGT